MKYNCKIKKGGIYLIFFLNEKFIESAWNIEFITALIGTWLRLNKNYSLKYEIKNKSYKSFMKWP